MVSYLWLAFMLGSFFTISGFRKSFVESTRSKVFGLFSKYGVKPAFGWAVVLGEFFGGVGLLLAPAIPVTPVALIPYTTLFSWLAALLLLPIMAGAIHLSVMPTLRRAWQASAAGRWQKVSNFLCTAEVMMTVGLVAMVLAPFG